MNETKRNETRKALVGNGSNRFSLPWESANDGTTAIELKNQKDRYLLFDRRT